MRPAPMAIPHDIQSLTETPAPRDPRALAILAKTIYRELRQSGLGEEEVMSVAGELLSLVATDVKGRRAHRDR